MNVKTAIADLKESVKIAPVAMSMLAVAHQPRKEQKLGLVDKLLAKAVSRKLLVFGTATALMVWSTLDPETWGLIAIVYVGGQSVVDAVKTYKHGGM